MKKPSRLPVIREDGTIEIHLTKGYVAIIDWVDVWAAGWNWNAVTTPTGHVYAACRGVLLHREICGLGARNGMDVDHKNGDGLNCRRENLRIISHKNNTHNRKMNRRNKTGVCGVRFDEKANSYTVTLSSEYIGSYKTLEDARQARLSAEHKFWGIHPQREHFFEGFDLQFVPERRPVRKSSVNKNVYTPRVGIAKNQ